VYETVELPAEMFNRWGQINFFQPTQGENALGPEYLVADSGAIRPPIPLQTGPPVPDQTVPVIPL